MPDGYSWSEVRDGGTYRLPGPEHIGWWAAMAMLVSILLHVVVFFALDRMKIALRFEQAREMSTGPINVRQVEVRPAEPETPVAPENTITPPNDAAALLEEVDLLDALPKDEEILIKPDVEEASWALEMKKPALEGEPSVDPAEVMANYDLETDLPELGREPESFQPAALGQITVDPGSETLDEDDLGKFADELLKQGAGGKTAEGALDGLATLDSLLDLPPNLLLDKKTMLPSDLLFEFNSSELRESAKVGLMKIALLMDRNPELYCWIEGHTDLVGGDEFNLDLSIRRAEAVKTYLADSLRMDADRISTRGYGRFSPIVIEGDRDRQSINRRVEIRMRKNPPATDQLKIVPKKATVVGEEPPPPAVLIKPKKALPVEEEPPPPAPPKAVPAESIPELPEVPRATPVEPTAPRRALPVEEP